MLGRPDGYGRTTSTWPRDPRGISCDGSTDEVWYIDRQASHSVGPRGTEGWRQRFSGPPVQAGSGSMGERSCGAAPGSVIFEKLGFTPENVAARAMAVLGR